VKHDLLNDYSELYIGKENGFPLFNGYMSRIELKVGPGSFL
jgi:hypothetical protein